AELHREEVEKIVLEGFYPLEDPQHLAPRSKRQGISEFGLPYESEPAVTRHLGWFLEQHRETVRQTLQRESHAPDLILFNGGSLKPALVQERILSAIGHWFGQKDDRLPRVLENPNPDLAVALGAAYYGLVKLGRGVRVGSGSPRAYYLGVGSGGEPAEGGRRQAICLVERGLDEGTAIELKDKKFEVRTNQPVSFDLFSSSYRSGDRCGDLVNVDDSLTALPPVQTVIQYGKKGDQQLIPVQVEAGYTEMGTLAIWCRSLIGHHRWQLQFQLRDAAAAAAVPDAAIIEDSVLTAARDLIQTAFCKGAEKRRLDGLVRGITEIAGSTKEKWPLGLIRALADELLGVTAARSWGPDFESRWLNLVGFCLRPGFGDGFDEHRLQSLWKVYLQGPAFPKNGQVRSEWWILWRRVAGGLKPGQQRQVSQDLTPLMSPKKTGGLKVTPQERVEIWMAVANLERLSAKDKTRWGRQLLAEIRTGKAKHQTLWALSRLGARELLYGPVDRVIPPEEVAGWIARLVAGDWTNPLPVGAALGQLARRTGDRVRDVSPEIAATVLAWMAQHPGMGASARLVKEVVPVARQEESTLFGESLPSGIVLHA
ncbi:MAG: molecular chaperone DnaK, partial [Desulfobacterales bacterium]